MRRLAAMTLPAPSTAMTPSTRLSSTRWSSCADGGALRPSAAAASGARASGAVVPAARLSVSLSTAGQCTPHPPALSKSAAGGSVQASRTASTKDAVGACLQVGVDVFDIGLDIAIARESLHDRVAVCPARQHHLPEGGQVERCGDQRRRERTADAIGTMTVDTDRVVAPVAIVGPLVDFAVDDAVELVSRRVGSRTGCDASLPGEQ